MVLEIFRATEKIYIKYINAITTITAAVLAQAVERVDCRAGGRGFDS